MFHHRALLPAAVVLGAFVLTVAFLPAALLRSGEYSAREDVRAVAAVGLLVSYLSAGALAAWALSNALLLGRLPIRVFAFVVGLLLTAALLYMAPMSVFLLLAGLCKFQPLCPEAANPMAWALSGTVYAHEKPFAAAWLTPILAATALVQARLAASRQ